MARTQRVYVENTNTGKKITLKKFKNSKTERLVISGITKKEILQSGFLAKEKLEGLIVKHKLPVTKRGNDIYIDKVKFAKAIQEEKLVT